jgi:competence ComEA-like helix-hairpin-helix protein
MGRLGIIHPFVSMWIPNLLFLFFAIYLFKKGKTESSIIIFEKLAWYLEIIKNKFRYVIEGGDLEETDYFSDLLDINTASQEELMLKLRIGEKKAASIIAYREEHGGIKYLEELKKVRGIGEKTFNKIKEEILI